MAAPNTFEGARLDRVTARRRDRDWVAAQAADPASRAVVAGPNGVLTDGDALALVPLDGQGEPLLLGVQDGRALFAVDGEGRSDLVSVREIAPALAQDEGGLLAYAAALLNWHRRHRFCSVCGTASEVREAGLLRVCPACGAEHHPRTDPVVIMLVVDGERDRVLLGRQAAWPAGRYSALAGFVEPGESLEDAVAREVFEESGVEVGDARYVSSQPWPFPSSLMLGFEASYVGGEVVAADGELEDARWFTRAELVDAAAERGDYPAPAAAGDRPAPDRRLARSGPVIDAAAVRSWCLARPGVTEERPFGPQTTVFKVEGKVFLLSALERTPLEVSLKCEPPLAEQLRRDFPAAVRAGLPPQQAPLEHRALRRLAAGPDDHRHDRGLLRPRRREAPARDENPRRASGWGGRRASDDQAVGSTTAGQSTGGDITSGCRSASASTPRPTHRGRGGTRSPASAWPAPPRAASGRTPSPSAGCRRGG